MKSDILDADDEKIEKSFAEKSFRNFAINLGVILFGGFFLLNGGMGIFILPLFFIPAFIGFIQGIKSIRLKEKSTWKKYVGIIGNGLLLLFPLSIIGRAVFFIL